MEELKKEKDVEIIIPKVRVLYGTVITTAITVPTKTESGIILSAKSAQQSGPANIMLVQQVVAVGDEGHTALKVGDIVELDDQMFRTESREPKHGIGGDVVSIIPPLEVIDKTPYLFVTDRHVKFIHNDGKTLKEIREGRVY